MFLVLFFTNTNRALSSDLYSLSEDELSMVFAKAAVVSSDFGDIYVDSKDKKIENNIATGFNLVNANISPPSSGKVVKIMAEDLKIETLTGGVSWKDTDGVDGNQAGVFTIFSHVPDVIHVDMSAPVEVEPKVGSIPGFTDKNVVYLEVRIPDLEIRVDRITKVFAMDSKMVTDLPHEYYKSGDIDPYSGRALNIGNDPNHLLDDPSTSNIDPARKYADNNQIFGVYYGTSSKITVCGALKQNGQSDINRPGRVYIYTH